MFIIFDNSFFLISLITLLKNYINKYNLNTTLFPENLEVGLSDFISSMNEKVKIGVMIGGINP